MQILHEMSMTCDTTSCQIPNAMGQNRFLEKKKKSIFYKGATVCPK